MSGVAKPGDSFSRHITRSLRGRLFAFDVVGAAKAKRILEVFRYARRRYGIDLFLLDNLTKCGFADDDYAGQKAFTEELCDFARTEDTHVMMVAHMRKGESEDKPAGKMSVKGSGGITDLVDTVIEVWRNKPRERAVKKAKEDSAHVSIGGWRDLVPDKYKDQGDALLLVHKQRATGVEPTYSLWYDAASTTYLSKPDHKPRPMVSGGEPLEHAA
jgi:twinkle protein